MRRRPAALALVAWTFFVWTTRIANIWRDEDLSVGDQVERTALALSFTLLAIGVLVALWRRAEPATAVAVGALAGWSVAVWVVRDVRIALGDHDVAFVVVHVVLGVVSVSVVMQPPPRVRRRP